MNMTVGDFVCAGRPDITHRDSECECFPCERVVGVNGDDVAFHGRHDHKITAMFAGGAEAHACLDFRTGWKDRTIHAPDAPLVPQSIGFDRRHSDIEFIAGSFALERFLEARDNASVAVQISHGCAALRTVEQFGAAVADFVIEGNDVVFGDFHEKEVFSVW